MREKIIELLQSVPADYDGNISVGAIADHLIENGVIIVDTETALAAKAGAFELEKSEYYKFDADYVYIGIKNTKSIPYRKAAEILRKLAENTLKEREENETR